MTQGMTPGSFIRDCWYVAAWDHEVPVEGLLARTIIGQPLVLFRGPDGAVAALEDRCCHRFAPLSRGRHENGSVRCGYHGLCFDASGRCTEVPGMDTLPKGLAVRAIPVVVHNRWVFVWMGEPRRADRCLLPDNFSCDHPDWVYQPGYLHYDVPWALIADNLLDFSHLSYVHEATLGGSTEIARARPTIQPIDRGLRISRRVAGVPPPPYYAAFRPFEGLVDRWLDYDFVLPATLLMDSGARSVGADPADPARMVRLHSCQALTPETATTTHYFFQQAHLVGLGDASTAGRLHAGVVRAFEEDRAMITAQYEVIRSTGEVGMKSLPMDAALLQFRTLVERTWLRENADRLRPTD
jgi:vanillate O-demethylase monooxygenase subunit